MLASNANWTDKSSEQTWTLVHHMPLLPFWGRAVLMHSIRHENITLMEHMKSYHYLDVWQLQIMGYYINQETTCRITFFPTFRKGLQQKIKSKTRPFYNEKDFENIYNIE